MYCSFGEIRVVNVKKFSYFLLSKLRIYLRFGMANIYMKKKKYNWIYCLIQIFNWNFDNAHKLHATILYLCHVSVLIHELDISAEVMRLVQSHYSSTFSV